jgi:hypothetical protein
VDGRAMPETASPPVFGKEGMMEYYYDVIFPAYRTISGSRRAFVRDIFIPHIQQIFFSLIPVEFSDAYVPFHITWNNTGGAL